MRQQIPLKPLIPNFLCYSLATALVSGEQYIIMKLPKLALLGQALVTALLARGEIEIDK
jgi:hypothetical protein